MLSVVIPILMPRKKCIFNVISSEARNLALIITGLCCLLSPVFCILVGSYELSCDNLQN